VTQTLIIIGLLLGSFLNMLIYRLPRNMNWVSDRSECIGCGRKLSLFDLVPLLSFLYSRGCCQHCGARIPIRYLLVELITPLSIVGAYYIDPLFSITFWVYAVFFLLCIALFFTDLETYILPTELTGTLIVFGFLMYGVFQQQYHDSILGGVIGFGVYAGIAKIAKWIYKKEALGGGDMMLGAGLGALWGVTHVVYTIYFSFLFGAMAGIIAIVFFKRGFKDYIPFGPMIILSSLFVLFFEGMIQQWMFKLATIWA